MSEPITRSHQQAKTTALIHGALGGIWLMVALQASWIGPVPRPSNPLILIAKGLFLILVRRAALITFIGAVFFIPCAIIQLAASRMSDERRWPFWALLALAMMEVIYTALILSVFWLTNNTAWFLLITTALVGTVNLSLLPMVVSALAALSLARRRIPGPNQALPMRAATQALAKRSRLYECKSCGHRMRSPRWLCPKCGQIVSAWTPPAGMMSDFARRRLAQTHPEADATSTAPATARAVRESRLFAARFILRHAPDAAGRTAEQALENPRLLRQLYLAAAKRLHPDRNQGRHLDEWFQLQQAAAIIKI